QIENTDGRRITERVPLDEEPAVAVYEGGKRNAEQPAVRNDGDIGVLIRGQQRLNRLHQHVVQAGKLLLTIEIDLLKLFRQARRLDHVLVQVGDKLAYFITTGQRRQHLDGTVRLNHPDVKVILYAQVFDAGRAPFGYSRFYLVQRGRVYGVRTF